MNLLLGMAATDRYSSLVRTAQVGCESLLLTDALRLCRSRLRLSTVDIANRRPVFSFLRSRSYCPYT